MKRRTSPTARTGKETSPTLLRAYRFKATLIRAFEEDCARQLRNSKVVFEALMQHWLKVSPKVQADIARHYRGKAL